MSLVIFHSYLDAIEIADPISYRLRHFVSTVRHLKRQGAILYLFSVYNAHSPQFPFIMHTISDAIMAGVYDAKECAHYLPSCRLENYIHPIQWIEEQLLRVVHSTSTSKALGSKNVTSSGMSSRDMLAAMSESGQTIPTADSVSL